MPIHTHISILDHPVEDVFAWHTRPRAFERLSPPWESVRVLEKDGEMWEGGRVLLGLRKGPVEIQWEVKHTAFEENVLFRDEQVRGPFGKWVHTHRFSAVGPGRMKMEDVIEWEAPFGPLGKVFGEPVIRSMLQRLFTFRHQRLAHDLDLLRRYPLKEGGATVAITGSTGLVGSALGALLSTGGHRVVPVVRGAAQPEGAKVDGAVPDRIHWDPARGIIQPEDFAGVDGVVHLAGESIASGRWNAARKERILKSRVEGTQLLAGALAQCSAPPAVLVSSSAAGWYGDRGDEELTEKSAPGTGFLADVCHAWEGAAEAAVNAGIRTVLLRTGIVLTPAGGALQQLLLPFQMGVGGRVGSGRQYMSWIDLDDEVGLILHALATEGLSGPMNATAPHPVTNAEFSRVLGRVLRRPALLPLPAPAVRTLFGDMGDALLLEGSRILPRVALDSGYRFLMPTLEESLRFGLGAGRRVSGS